jgi:hypothetical protein
MFLCGSYMEVDNRFFRTTMQVLCVDCYAYCFNEFGYASQLRQPASGSVRVVQTVQTVQVLDQKYLCGQIADVIKPQTKSPKDSNSNSFLFPKRKSK